MAFAVGVFLWLLANQRPPHPGSVIEELSGQSMGTTWHVQVALPAPADPRLAEMATTIPAQLERLDRGIFSTYAPDSELSRLNAAPVGKPVPVSRELQEVLLLARTINRQSYGTFDITVGPLVNLWGFGPDKHETLPDEAAITAARKRLGADKYELDLRNGTATRLADIGLDLSAIAKGYAVDKVAELLLASGFHDFVVEIGGELRVQGWRQPEQGWNLAIEEPHNGPSMPQARVDNRGQGFAMAGSGDYRNYFEADGKRYSHEIDPHSGKPVSHALTAVSVLAQTAAEADAWATAMMVLGPVDGPLLAGQRDLAVYFIIRKDQGDGFDTRATPSFEQYLGK